MSEVKTTPFSAIFEAFYTRVTDDMYMEMTELDTLRDLQDILEVAIYRFEFPRFDVDDREPGEFDYIGDYCGYYSDYETVPAVGWVGGYFNAELTKEEINILALSMMVEWFGRQIATTELTKEKYSGADFKFTSQANHMAKLKVMQDAYRTECFHLQRLYKRRKKSDKTGIYKSTFGSIMQPPSAD